MPSAWEKRFVRQGKYRGEEVLLVAPTRARGVWTAVRPSLAVSTVDVRNRGAVGLLAARWVRYVPIRELSDAEKEAARAASEALVAAGVPRAQLGGWAAPPVCLVGMLRRALFGRLFAKKAGLKS